ncbi:hypothetical protein [Nonomuraea sp. NPDC049129]|uniref:hypothetical protein n=1 Tax=Nonomuraea sp. NPDC049129 TaxID=3155272 RepID=UPI00340CDF76
MDLDPASLGVIVAGVSAILSAVVALMAPRLTFRYTRALELDRRRFEKRSDVYVDLVAHLWDLRNLTDPQSPSTDESQGRLTTEENRRLEARVHAFASAEVDDLHNRVTIAYLTWFNASGQLRRSGTSADPRPSIGDAYQAETARRAHARKTLKEAIAELEQQIRDELQPDESPRSRRFGRSAKKALRRES